jgi:hypothetical protein
MPFTVLLDFLCLAPFDFNKYVFQNNNLFKKNKCEMFFIYLGKFRESFPAALLDQGLEPNTRVLEAQAQCSELEFRGKVHKMQM